jgi:hypothetical protein
MRASILTMLIAAAAQGVWAQQVEKPTPAPRAGTAVRHGAPAPARTTVEPALPNVAPSAPRDLRSSPVLSPLPGSAPSSPFDAGPLTYAPRYRPGDRLRPPRNWGSGYYGYTVPYEIVDPSPTVTAPGPSAEALANGGSLLLEVEPRTADVYVDGFYIGSVSDVIQNGVLLTAGRHWIDLRAAGYDTLTVPVNVQAGQAVRYRGALASVSAKSASGPARGPQTIYLITGCYAGNRPPNESALPVGCDISKLRTLTSP